MSSAVEPEPETLADSEPEFPADPRAGFALTAATVAAIVCFATWGFGMLMTGAPVPVAYLTHLGGTWIAPTVIVVIGWIVYLSGCAARPQGRSPVATKALAFLVLHTVVLGLVAVCIALLAAALQASFG